MDLMMPRTYKTREGEEKTAWTKIGVAFSTNNGGWKIRFEALPAPQMGRDGQIETVAMLMPPKDFDGEKKGGGYKSKKPRDEDFGEPPF